MSGNSEIVKSGKASPLHALGAKFSIEPSKLVDVLRGTVIKPDRNGRHASNEELAAFCVVANQYGLNPFTREIHAFADPQKGVVPIVSIDGWARIVNNQPEFDGCEFIEDGEGNTPVAVTCVMYVKGRSHPVKVTERFSECVRKTGPWGQMPWRMLRHKAFMQAARIAFSLSGIYDEDEARDIVPIPAVEDTTAKPGESKMAKHLCTAKPEPEPEPPTKEDEPPIEVEPEEPVQEEGTEAELSEEQQDLINRLLPYEDGFPKAMKRFCEEMGLDAEEWKSAPVPALKKLLAKLDNHASR